MGRLVEGAWVSEEQWHDDKDGRFKRKPTTFRGALSTDGSTPHAVESGRYHLYASWACPWAHRVLIVRALRGLEEHIGLSVVDHLMTDDGWHFSDEPGAIPDTVNGAKFLRDIYVKADPKVSCRVTVPVLWDKVEDTIVNNESREIIRMLDTVAMGLGDPDVTFCPPGMESRIDAVIDAIYEPINNGVYRSGFAGSQGAYLEAVTELFEALDHYEDVLSKQRYLCGDVITEADWCLFTTLVRFDVVYYTHFKCNLKHVYEYPNLFNYLKELYQVPGVKETCNFAHIKGHYFESHTSINPHGIVPKGPRIALGGKHDRDRFA